MMTLIQKEREEAERKVIRPNHLIKQGVFFFFLFFFPRNDNVD